MVLNSMDLKVYMARYTTLINTLVTITENYVSNFLTEFINKFQYKNINIELLITNIVKGLPNEVNLNTFYNFAADQCVVNTSIDPEYNHLASNILVERLHLATPDTLLEVSNILYNNIDTKGDSFPLLSDNYYNLVVKYTEQLEKIIDYSKDYDFDYFGIRTLERSYLMKVRKYNRTWRKVTSEDVVIERPSHMYLRVALSLHQNDLNSVKESYDLMMNKYFTHATPTLFNAGQGYQIGDTVTFSGTQLGGQTPANDLTLTLHVTPTGGHVASVTTSGTVKWPQSSLGTTYVLPNGEDFVNVTGNASIGVYFTGNCATGNMYITPIGIAQ